MSKNRDLKNDLKFLTKMETQDECDDVGKLYEVAINFRDRWEELNKAVEAFINVYEHDPKDEKQQEAYDVLEELWVPGGKP